MKKTLFPVISLVVAISLLFSVFGCATPAPSPAPAPAPAPKPAPVTPKKFVLNFAYFGGPNTPWIDMVMNPWAEYVNARINPNYSLEMQYHFGGVLAKGPEQIDGIQAGTFEGTQYVASYVPTKAPLTEITFHPIWPASPEGTALAIRDYSNHPLIKAELAKWDAMPLMPSVLPHHTLISIPPVKSLADLKGLQIRTAGKVYADLITKFGAVNSSILTTEAYGAMQTGVIDGVTTGDPLAIHQYKYEDIAKNIFDFGWGRIAALLIIKKSWFESLPPEVKTAMLEEANNKVAEMVKVVDPRESAVAYTAFDKAGVVRTNASPADKQTMDKLIAGMIDQWAVDRGPQGQQMVTFWKELTTKYK